MTVPTYDHFIEPLLRFLAEHPEGVKAADAHEAVATMLGLSEEDRSERIPSGTQPLYKNRNGWAHDRIKRANLSTSPRIGFWRLTPEGVEYTAKHKHLTDAEVERLAATDKTSRLRPKKGEDGEMIPATYQPAAGPDKSSPEERIEDAIEELRESVARDLLENIGARPHATSRASRSSSRTSCSSTIASGRASPTRSSAAHDAAVVHPPKPIHRAADAPGRRHRRRPGDTDGVGTWGKGAMSQRLVTRSRSARHAAHRRRPRETPVG